VAGEAAGGHAGNSRDWVGPIGRSTFAPSVEAGTFDDLSLFVGNRIGGTDVVFVQVFGVVYIIRTTGV